MKTLIVLLALALPGDRVEADCFIVESRAFGRTNVCHFQPRGYDKVHCWGVSDGLSCVVLP